MVGWSPQGLFMMQAAYVDLAAIRADPDEYWPPDTDPVGTDSRRRDYIDILRSATEAQSSDARSSTGGTQ